MRCPLRVASEGSRISVSRHKILDLPITFFHPAPSIQPSHFDPMMKDEIAGNEVTESTADESCCSESTLSHQFDGFSCDSYEEEDVVDEEEETEHSEMNEFLPPLPCITISTSLSSSLTLSRRTSDSSTGEESGVLSLDSQEALLTSSSMLTTAGVAPSSPTPQRRLSRTDSRRSALSSSKADPLSSSSAHLRRSSFRSSRGLCRTTSNQNSLHELYSVAQESSSILGTGSNHSHRHNSLDGPSNHSLRSFLYVPPALAEGQQRIESLCDILDSALDATA